MAIVKKAQVLMIYAQVSTIFILTILLYEDIKELFGEHSKYKYIFNYRKRNLSSLEELNISFFSV